MTDTENQPSLSEWAVILRERGFGPMHLANRGVMNVLFWIGVILWFPSVGLILASRLFKRWQVVVFQTAAAVSVIGAVLLAIATPALSNDSAWRKVLYDLILAGWSVLGITVVLALRKTRTATQRAAGSTDES